MTFPPNLLHARNLRLGIAAVAALGLLVAIPAGALGATTQPTVGLGTAKSFAVLAGTKIDGGASKISGDVGLSPGPKSAITGFPPAIVTNGTVHAADAVALQAQADLAIAYKDTAGRFPPTLTVTKDLGGQTLTPGVYKAPSHMQLTGTVTLDGQNNPNAVFIFQAGSDLITASTSEVKLINGASSCDVFWQVTSSATVGSASRFRGTVLALTSIVLDSGATVDGRVLARNGAVTLHGNIIRSTQCVVGAVAAASATATPTSQVSAVPAGAVRTGDGSTSGNGTSANGAIRDNGLVLLTGALLLAGIGGGSVVAARRRRVNI